jgi:hypothetical protein
MNRAWWRFSKSSTPILKKIRKNQSRSAENMKTKAQPPSKIRPALALAAAVIALVAHPAPAQTATEFQQLKTLVEQMQKTIAAQNSRIADLEKQKVPPAPVAAPLPSPSKDAPFSPIVGQPSAIFGRENFNDQQAGAPRLDNQTLDPNYTGFFPIPNTPVIMKVNAKPRVDFTLDNRNSGNPDRFVTAQIPIQGTAAYGGGSQANINSRGSQLSLDARGPDLAGAPRFYYEMDFFGGGNGGGMTPRVRQLYGQYYNIIAGFSTSVFEDPDAWPDTVDYEGPNSAIFARQPGIRYQLALNDHWQMNFGIQQPSTDLDPGVFVDASAVNHAPDGGFNVRWEDQQAGHVQLGTIFRALGANDPVAGDQTVFGWGLNLAGSLNVWAKDSLQFQGTYGRGVFHYINDNSVNNDVTYDNRGNLTALPFFGAMAGYTHPWTERLRSTAAFGYNHLDNESGQGPQAYHETYYTTLNLMWQPRKRLTLGFEGLYGRKEVQNGGSGDVFRLQFSIVYALFPSGTD